MEQLRAPNGCPWDKEQTFESILDCFVEETYEYIDAVIKKDVANMKEELGDVLLQVVFHAQIAKEQNLFTIEEVIQEISAKLIRRHPHVFKSKKNQTITVKDVEKIWEREKQKEKYDQKQTSLFDSISQELPNLLKANKIQKKAAKLGFDWDSVQGPLEKVKEETQELIAEINKKNKNQQEEELGDLLFAVVNVARQLKINPDLALQKANYKFTFRFEKMLQKIEQQNLNPKKLSLGEWDEYWKVVKENE